MNQITLSKQLGHSKNRMFPIRVKKHSCRFPVSQPSVNLESCSVHQLHQIHHFSTTNTTTANPELNLEESIKKFELLMSLQEHEEKCVQNVLQSFTRAELVQIVKEAAAVHPDILDTIISFAECDESRRKLFISCLSPKINSEGLGEYFSKYGEVEEAKVIFDKSTGNSRGFGFVTFKTVESFLLALEDPSKNIEGCVASASVCVSVGSGSSNSAISNGENRAKRKIRVENVPMEMVSDSLIKHFSRYGEIEQGPWGFDMGTGKLKSNVYFLYKNEESARAAVAKRVKHVDGFKLTCKMAMKDKERSGDAVMGSWESIPSPLRVLVLPVFYSYYYSCYGGIETYNCFRYDFTGNGSEASPSSSANVPSLPGPDSGSV